MNISVVRKGEIRALVEPGSILQRLESNEARRTKFSEGTDIYFGRELFENGYHFRARKQRIYYPKKTEEYFIHIKDHEPDYRKMNVYTTYALPQHDHKETVEAMKLLGHKEIFTEKWKGCTEFELNDTKIEVVRIINWGWLVELEGAIRGPKTALYSKLIETLGMIGLDEQDLTRTEPAAYLFKRKYG